MATGGRMDSESGPNGDGADHGQRAIRPSIRTRRSAAGTNTIAIVALVLGIVLPPLSVLGYYGLTAAIYDLRLLQDAAGRSGWRRAWRSVQGRRRG
jgi:hypothetical protein